MQKFGEPILTCYSRYCVQNCPYKVLLIFLYGISNALYIPKHTVHKLVSELYCVRFSFTLILKSPDRKLKLSTCSLEFYERASKMVIMPINIVVVDSISWQFFLSVVVNWVSIMNIIKSIQNKSLIKYIVVPHKTLANSNLYRILNFCFIFRRQRKHSSKSTF